MATTKIVGAPKTIYFEGKPINWKAAQETVRRLQERIAKAARLGKFNKVKVLQRFLAKSFSAMALAVKRVTSNKGKKTPGIDKVIWKTQKQKESAIKDLLKRKRYKASPLRRIYIPKKNGKLRPLGIPTMMDRAYQAIHLMTLDPVSETLADKNSYGFRPRRSLHDAIAACFTALARKNSAQWILEGDIKACFDKISHGWLLNNIPMDKSVLKAWLEAGYMEDKNLFETKEGTPQGGIASPTLANMALDGLEETVKVIGKQRDKINFVRYADDWIITGSSRELLEEKVLPVVSAFLKERGLELSPEKTKITHIDEGFDFLGFNIRKYKGKLLIKPGDKGIKAFTAKIGEIIDSSLGAKTEDLINRLNPIIRGWAEHNKRVVAKETFSKVDHTIFQKVWNWTKRRHSNKSMRWIKEKYFIKIRNRDWVFFSREKDKKSGNKKIVTLIRATNTQITRHIKILSKANPYDPGYSEYFQQRSYKQRRRATGSSNNDLRKA